MKAKDFSFTGIPSTYLELVRMHEPRPIRTEAEFDAATVILQRMAGHELNRDQDDYLDVLTGLVHDYDRRHHAIRLKRMSPLEALRYLVKENGMNASDLGRLIGNRAMGSKILRGERDLSKANILCLAKRFCVNPAIFLAEAAFKKAG